MYFLYGLSHLIYFLIGKLSYTSIAPVANLAIQPFSSMRCTQRIPTAGVNLSHPPGPLHLIYSSMVQSMSRRSLHVQFVQCTKLSINLNSCSQLVCMYSTKVRLTIVNNYRYICLIYVQLSRESMQRRVDVICNDLLTQSKE